MSNILFDPVIHHPPPDPIPPVRPNFNITPPYPESILRQVDQENMLHPSKNPLLRKLPYTLRDIKNRKRKGIVRDPTNIQVAPELTAAKELLTGSSPFPNPPLNKVALHNLDKNKKKYYRKKRKGKEITYEDKIKSVVRKTKALKPVKRLTKKGGIILTHMKNLYVDPESKLRT